MTEVRGKRVLVVGLARSGQAAALCLQRRGAVVTVTDLRPPAEFQNILPEIVAQKIGLELGSQRQETFLRHDLIVVSPGVPWDLPQLQAARGQRIPIVPEVEAASWFLEGTLVGITGSNGKTTTATLLGKILAASGFPTFVGGNIGVPLSSAVDVARPGTIFVTELSSFQLEAIQEFRPHVAVFLNLSPNHLDRHPSFEAYAQAKRQIFRNQTSEDHAILNADDAAVVGLAPAVASRPVFFARQEGLFHGVLVSNGHILYRVNHLERVLLETREVPLRGDFNLENVLAATAAACVLGADFQAIHKAVCEFQGVEHRLEFVREISGVEFFNNSKATSVDATVKSLGAFDRGVHLILGGKDKGAPYAPLRPLLEKRVRDVLLIGAAADRIAGELSGAAELVRAGDLATAVWEAFQRAQPGDVVLLAPACSSFDQFTDYEHRGRVFKDLVENLAREVESGELVRREVETGIPSFPGATAAPAQQDVASTPAGEGPKLSGESPPGAAGLVGGASGLASAPAVFEKTGVAPAAEAGAPPAGMQPEPVPEESSAFGEGVEWKGVVAAGQFGAAAGIEELPQAGVSHPAGRETAPVCLPPESEPTSLGPVPDDATTPSELVRTEDAAPGMSPEAARFQPAKEAGAIASTATANPLDPIGIYEVAAEEFPPGTSELSPRVVDGVESLGAKVHRSPEAVEDEPLPFEARATTSAAAGMNEEFRLSSPNSRSTERSGSPASPETGVSGTRPAHPSRSAGSSGQPRLPGIE